MCSMQIRPVSLGDVVEKRKTHISEVEAWALLCQAVQALQDLFLNGAEEEKLGAECSLAGVQLTPKGRVILGQRPRPIPHPRLSDSHLEKMWIYSLGVTVRGIVSWTEASVGLKTILSRMLSPDLHSRASLMDLLDVISAYCRGRKNSKPLSHIIMDMYSQTFDTTCNGSGVPSHSTPKNNELGGGEPVQSETKQTARVGARLYIQPINGAKYCGPNTLIGPEFIVRASDPTGLIHLGDNKVGLRRKILVVLLNGQKLEITCDPLHATFADVFQIVTTREGLENCVTLGLAALVSDDFVFPPAELKVSKVAPGSWSKNRGNPPPFTLYLRFRLYLPSLRGTRSWKWKHLLYLQLRRSLLERQLRAERLQLLALAGLALQAEFGDFPSPSDGQHYFLVEHYLPEGEGSYSELSALHKQRSGLDPGRAEEMFITHSMILLEYGTHYTTGCMVGKEGATTEVWIGVNSKGVVLCYKRDFSASMVRVPHYVFNWPDIKKLSYSKHFFEIVSAESKYKLKLEGNKSLYLFRMAWLHHKFFMKLSNEYTTLQNLTDEFGLKGKETKGVFHVSPKEKRTELSALRRAASLLSPDRAIFRGKTATHCSRNARSESCREPRVSSPLSLPSTPVNPPSALNQPIKSCHSADDSIGRGARRRVLMGTRAIYSSSQHDLLKITSPDLDSPSPLPEAYILNTNIRSEDDKFQLDLQDTLGESFVDKFDDAFSNERILTTVRLKRGKNGGLGLHVVEGKDGHCYVISALRGTTAYECGLIYSGDQIQAVNGENVLNLPYKEALRLVQNAGEEVELLLSQVNRGQKTSLNFMNKINGNVRDSKGFDLMSILQRPIEESYFNAIRYQIATETEDMIDTELPRSLSYL